MFTGQVAVVTGATGAIGNAIATRLVTRGATLCAVGSSRESLERHVETSGWPLNRVECYSADFRNEAEIRRFCGACAARHEQIHVLVHCAGAIELGAIQEASLDDFDRQFHVNVRAPLQITQALLPNLTSCEGQIAFINSTAGVHARGGVAQYAASKHALKALADSLREEVNAQGVRVVSLFLGRTASGMQQRVHSRESRSYDGSKLIQPEDVASILIHALEMARTTEITDVWMRPLLKSY